MLPKRGLWKGSSLREPCQKGALASFKAISSRLILISHIRFEVTDLSLHRGRGREILKNIDEYQSASDLHNDADMLATDKEGYLDGGIGRCEDMAGAFSGMNLIQTGLSCIPVSENFHIRELILN